MTSCSASAWTTSRVVNNLGPEASAPTSYSVTATIRPSPSTSMASASPAVLSRCVISIVPYPSSGLSIGPASRTASSALLGKRRGRRGCSEEWVSSLPLRPADKLAGDDDALDVAGALVDLEALDVAEVTFDR